MSTMKQRLSLLIACLCRVTAERHLHSLRMFSMQKNLHIVIVLLILGGSTLSVNAQTATPAPPIAPAYQLVFEYQLGPDVPTLLELSLGAVDDAAILEQVVAYYEANAERLALLWREDNPVRLAGIFAMYITHISLPYGETPFPNTITEFVTQERAHCGTYLVPQTRIALALGLTIRTIEFVGEHAWLEIYVDDRWELFDATTNTWLSRTGVELLEGAQREYRYFYTPMLDINRPDARLHFDEGYNMQRLRQRMPLMGVSYFPPGERIVSPPLGSLADQLPPI